jgi:hypothetical protein
MMLGMERMGVCVLCGPGFAAGPAMIRQLLTAECCLV